ncbi:hypothetical protein ACGFMM_08585 [Streptomyces sp. NPDC048604]|uniref:hypothetical protein n=1 Tax=Streptomyces sp. NPDC048604 TaxID=3365578 RepID=UPI003716E0BC
MASSLERLRAAQQVVDQLKAELDALDVILPSMGVDPMTIGGSGPSSPYPLIELGRCNMDTARQLVAVLSGARAAVGPAEEPGTSGEVLRARVRAVNREGRLP